MTGFRFPKLKVLFTHGRTRIEYGTRERNAADVRDAGNALVFEKAVVLVEPAILEHSDLLAQRLLELKHTWMLEIEAFRLIDALDIGPKSLSQINCGEHLHSYLQWSHNSA
jgi:hypothetical protein